MKQYDAIIIGLDKAGEKLAIELAKQKWSVAVIELPNDSFDIIRNDGFQLIEALYSKAQSRNTLKQESYENQAVFYQQAIIQLQQLLSSTRNKIQTELNSYPNITLYQGTFSFIAQDILKVYLPNNEEEIQGKEIFINIGSENITPAIDGINNSKHFFTATSLLLQNTLPKHLIIISDGNYGLEYASMYAAFGSKITIIISNDSFMPQVDKDISDCVQSIFQKNNIDIYLNSQPLSIQDSSDGVQLSFTNVHTSESQSIDGDAILAISGRKPISEDFNLFAVGVNTNENGYIITNNHLHTTLPHIWAMGDAVGESSNSNTAIDDCHIILNKLFGNEERTTEDRIPVPYTLLVVPPLAHIGITETEAEQKEYPFKVFRVVVSDTLRQTNGIMKAIINTDTGRIIGCTLFCDKANEVINLVNLAMKTELHYTYLQNFIFTHPSISEKLNLLFTIE